jgi:hypothetical protein
MKTTYQIAVGTKLIFIKDCAQYRKGDIIEVSSYDKAPSGYAFSFHGISGYIWGYTFEVLQDLRERYPHGNFSLPEKDLNALDILITEWDT